MLTKFWFKIAGKKGNTLLGEVRKYLINSKTYIKFKNIISTHTRARADTPVIYAFMHAQMTKFYKELCSLQKTSFVHDCSDFTFIT